MNRTDHRTAAQDALTDADLWGKQAEEPTPEVGELTCLAYAAVHALLAIHDALTAADRYAANEAKQREEAEPDPLDEPARPHTRRLASCVERWPDCASGEYNPACCRFPKSCSPLAPDTAQDAARDDLSASEGESGAEAGSDTDDAQEPLLCPACGLAGVSIDEHNARGCRYVMCDCKLSPSDIARALTADAVKAERLKLAGELRTLLSTWRDDGAPLAFELLATRWEQQ